MSTTLSTAQGPNVTLHGPGLLMLFAGSDRLWIGEGQDFWAGVLARWALDLGWWSRHKSNHFCEVYKYVSAIFRRTIHIRLNYLQGFFADYALVQLGEA